MPSGDAISAIHNPVLLKEILEYLRPKPQGVYVDGNLGMGGHTEAILAASAPTGRVIGFDWDAKAVELAGKRLAQFASRVTLVRDNFAALKRHLRWLRVEGLDGLLLDLGLSSYQLDRGARGFSFRGREPLDMRMDDRLKVSAAHLLNTATEDELADIFYYYGEERQARRIADFVVQARKGRAFVYTDELVEVIERAVPKRFWPKKIHVATKVFQALRIVVNGEMDNLAVVLRDGVEALNPGGIFCVISFHSLEDRLVKKAFRESRELRLLTKRPVVPGEKECGENPRARSAKLRVAVKK